MCAIFELKCTDKEFNDIYINDTLSGLLRNGYCLELTPCKYEDKTYSLMVEVGDIDESFMGVENE